MVVPAQSLAPLPGVAFFSPRPCELAESALCGSGALWIVERMSWRMFSHRVVCSPKFAIRNEKNPPLNVHATEAAQLIAGCAAARKYPNCHIVSACSAVRAPVCRLALAYNAYARSRASTPVATLVFTFWIRTWSYSNPSDPEQERPPVKKIRSRSCLWAAQLGTLISSFFQTLCACRTDGLMGHQGK